MHGSGAARLERMPLRIVATKPNPALVTLPWHIPLEKLTDEYVTFYLRGTRVSKDS